MDAALDNHGLRRLSYDAPALDLTGMIAKLDNHYFKPGGFSDVYRSRYTSTDGVKEAAVKVFRFHFAVTEHEGDTTRNDKMIRRELGIWRRLSHPNIVPFLGIVYGFERSGTTSLVSEWMPNGALGPFLGQYNDQLAIAHRIQLLSDIANGLCYLHSFPMVHGDLTCTNVLLDRNFNARLTDFGLASMVGDIPDALRYLQMTTTRPGALRWAAPEHFSDNANAVTQRTTKSDIYSFGNLALLTLSGKHPWSEVPRDIAVVLRLSQGDKPSRPLSRLVEDSHWELIERCWSPVSERPQAGDIVSSLQRFLASCSPVPPLRNLIGIPSGGTIEPSDMNPNVTRTSARGVDALNCGYAPDMKQSRATDTGQPASGDIPNVSGEQECKRSVRNDRTASRSPILRMKQPQFTLTDFVSEEFTRYISTEVPHRLIDTSTMKFVERAAFFDVFSEEIGRISEEDIATRMRSSTKDGVTTPRNVALREIIENAVKYATLSHCWTDDEPSYRDICAGNQRKHHGFRKLSHFCEAAKSQGYALAWSDTCCINESNRTEHVEAVQSASNWCAHSHLCIIHLVESTSYSDLSSETWFTRSWTLLELLVPKQIKLYNTHWQPLTNFINDKDDENLMAAISAVTLIPKEVLIADNRRGLKGRGVWEIMSWASKRKSTRVEDMAYSLCGLFNITIPIAYGEGDRAFYKLLEAIINKRKCSWDVFAWAGVPSGYHSTLPSTPRCYPVPDKDLMDGNVGVTDFSITTHGLSLTSVPLIPLEFDSWVSTAAGSVTVTLRPRPTPELGRYSGVEVVRGVLGPWHLRELREAQDLRACILNYRLVGQNEQGELTVGQDYVCFLLHSRHWLPEGPTWRKFTTDNQLRISYREGPTRLNFGPETKVFTFPLEKAHVEAQCLP